MLLTTCRIASWRCANASWLCATIQTKHCQANKKWTHGVAQCGEGCISRDCRPTQERLMRVEGIQDRCRLRVALVGAWCPHGCGRPQSLHYDIAGQCHRTSSRTASITSSPGNVIERALEKLPLRHRRAMSSNEFQVRTLANELQAHARARCSCIPTETKCGDHDVSLV